MNIDDLTLGQIKSLQSIMGRQPISNDGISSMIGKKVIIRTYSAGNWFGILKEKAGTEVIIGNARRMWRWHCAKSISLSGVALYGINEGKSRIAPALDEVWLDAIEILPCSDNSIKTLEGAKDAEAD